MPTLAPTLTLGHRQRPRLGYRKGNQATEGAMMAKSIYKTIFRARYHGRRNGIWEHSFPVHLMGIGPECCVCNRSIPVGDIVTFMKRGKRDQPICQDCSQIHLDPWDSDYDWGEWDEKQNKYIGPETAVITWHAHRFRADCAVCRIFLDRYRDESQNPKPGYTYIGEAEAR